MRDVLQHWRESWRDYRTVYGWSFPLHMARFEVQLWLSVRGWYQWGLGLRWRPRRWRRY